LQNAIKKANLEEFTKTQPQGIYTRITEHGNNISGGQKQRIALARSFYKNAKILIWDEATTGLNKEIEDDIISTVANTKDLTLIMVTHNLKSLHFCNRIFEIKSSKKIQEYTFEELEKNKDI